MKKKLLSITILAATALSATAVDKLLVVGDATWGGWSLDQTAVMVKLVLGKYSLQSML